MLFGEMHPKLAPKIHREPLAILEDGRKKGHIGFADGRDARQWYNYIMGRGFKGLAPSACKTKWIYADDESYHDDTTPLPASSLIQ